MENLEKILKATLGEIEKILSTRGVVGEPITIGDNTIIPLSSIGFGFGAGAGGGKEAEKAACSGEGSGSGGGGGIKPVAVVIINADGVRVEPLKRTTTDVIDKVGEIVIKAVEKRGAGKKTEEAPPPGEEDAPEE
jgi:uncharacterized spore protein YtfJ